MILTSSGLFVIALDDPQCLKQPTCYRESSYTGYLRQLIPQGGNQIITERVFVSVCLIVCVEGFCTLSEVVNSAFPATLVRCIS